MRRKPGNDGARVHAGRQKVNTMTTIGITGAGLDGVLRMTWVQDQLAHVLEHSETDEA
jgi:hypothetical protein